MKEYFLRELKFTDTSKYKSLNLAINFKWNWSSAQKEFYFTVVPEFAAAVLKHREMKIFIAGGIFDMATPLWSAMYQLNHSGIPQEQISVNLFPTGHSIFEDEDQLKILAGMIRKIISRVK